MFVVTVRFTVFREHVESFRDAVLQQASDSRTKETECRQFDVCHGVDDESVVFLYERYDNRNAFDLHLQSEHYRNFDATVRPWVANKEVQLWTRSE